MVLEPCQMKGHTGLVNCLCVAFKLDKKRRNLWDVKAVFNF